ncbi:MAG: Hsp20/alpha crystallin family protein [Planctomycetota bacterium]|nr:MAG: Hsp20/alpha crystallin family protein [Planctomycetota bacterium]
MALRNLIRRSRSSALTPERSETEHPLLALQRDLNRAFEALWRGEGFGSFGTPFGELATFSPKIEVREDEGKYTVLAELPGLDENDISVSLTDDALVISGEKKQELEEEKEGVYHSEIRYGQFSRTIPLPEQIDAEHVSAKFHNGVLTVELPKSAAEQEKVRKIEIKKES